MTKKITLLIMLSTLLGCINPVVHHLFVDGQQRFALGDYDTAFSELLPAAKAGNPDAEYAIGYMYYYGKGVIRDSVLARQWMERAAKRGQKNAKKALIMIDAESGQWTYISRR